MKTIEKLFSENLRRLRGLRTQAEVAEMAGIPLRSYQRMEYGDIPQAPNRMAVAKALGVQETQLFQDFELQGTQTVEALLKVIQLQEDQIRMLRKTIHDLSKEQKKNLITSLLIQTAIGASQL